MRFDTYLKVRQLAASFDTYDPFVIADRLGFKVSYRDLGTNLGFTQNILGFTHIVLSSTLAESPKRMPVMAHELCHGVEHEDCAAWYTVGNVQKNSMEYQANMFAFYELSQLYQEQYDQRPDDFKTLQMAYVLPEEYYQYFSSADTLS